MTEEAPAKVKLDLLDLPIRVWTPLKPGDVCLAKIGHGPMLFQGPTPGAVYRIADEWRKEERAKFDAKFSKTKKAEAAE